MASAGGQQSDPSLPSALVDGLPQLARQAYDIAYNISRQPGIPSQVSTCFMADIRNLNERYANYARELQRDYDTLTAKHEALSARVAEQQRLLQNALAERDRASKERDDIQSKYDRLSEMQQRLKRKLTEVERELKVSVDNFRREIHFKDEQITGKRSLWMENHPSSNVKHSSTAIARDPYVTPSGNHVPGRGIGPSLGDLANLTSQLQQTKLTSGPSASKRFPLDLPTGPPRPSQHDIYELKISGSGPACRAEQGSVTSTIVGPSAALVPFKTEEEIAQEFMNDFNKLYGLIQGWANTYGHHVNPESADQEASRDEELWKFMLECTFPDSAGSKTQGNHVEFLLRKPETRPFFIMRMIVQYIYKSIWVASAFKEFDAVCDQKLDFVEAQLQVKGLLPTQRAELVDLRTTTVQYILTHPRYLSWQRMRLSQLTHDMRTTVGPFLNQDAPRKTAGSDIGLIVINAFDLSSRMFTSNQTFVITFPDCGGKFLHTSMICRDPHVTEEALRLHVRQARLKLVLTPVINMRDDRHQPTIKVRNLQFASVLIMG